VGVALVKRSHTQQLEQKNTLDFNIYDLETFGYDHSENSEMEPMVLIVGRPCSLVEEPLHSSN
ncbi:MAG: hypothetical protein CL916_02110, partial [Deltaproteobacteria bacterium]|nr:hypothetical protein [Deltaproteobacteria bacterium]